MTASKNNLLVHRVSGNIGDLVFRRNPDIGKPLNAGRIKYQMAVFYGMAVLRNFELGKVYGLPSTIRQSDYKIAIADFTNAPDINEIDLSGYTGQPNQRISIKVSDDFPATFVSLAIHNEDGFWVEEGDAVRDRKVEIGYILLWHVTCSLKGIRSRFWRQRSQRTTPNIKGTHGPRSIPQAYI